ncbi:hypothetical protein LX32DRAFT_641603 [Colletotrichum zoysiae]|uniref:Uncharacterized protein n=1 Tax=Colletotrichum zoysiae TaxID=1216348 RepID=A0AAD9LY44_9PEZI|nr:hypothetical protein LX32DRAFT_641603 [Colletotrichum zoysiae]
MPLPSHGRLVSVAPSLSLSLGISLHPCEDIHEPGSPVSLRQNGMVGNTMSTLLHPPPPPRAEESVSRKGKGIGDSLASASEKKRQGGVAKLGRRGPSRTMRRDRRTALRYSVAYNSN